MILVLIRLCLAPAILLMAHEFKADAATAIVTCMWVAMLTDVFDGIIARKLGVATPFLRKLDSNVDLLFWICAIAAAYMVAPGLVRSYRTPIWIIIGLEILVYLVSFLRFRKGPSNHAYITKLWGVLILCTLSSIISTGVAEPWFALVFIIGVIGYVDGLAIILLIPKWQSDIPSSWHAMKIRRE